MSTLEESLQNPKFCNWVRAALALDFTKEAVIDFVVCTNNKSHADAIEGIPDICPSCGFESSCLATSKHCAATATLRTNIRLNHCRNVPTFGNTTPNLCWSNPWEFAKCFMGYAYKKCKSEDDTDVVGLLSVMVNNLDFQAYLKQDRNIIREVIGTRNEIMHNPSLEIDDQTFSGYIADIDALLSILPVTKDTKQGRDKIHQLSTGNLAIGSTTDITRCIQEAVNSLKSKNQKIAQSIYIMEKKHIQYTKEIQKEKDTGIEEIRLTVSNGKIELERKTKEGLENLENKSEQVMQKIDDKGQNIIQKGNEIDARIKQQSLDCMSALTKKGEYEKRELIKQLKEGKEHIEKCTEDSKARLHNVVESIMQEKCQAKDVNGQIESKSDHITEITKQSVGELETVARACMEEIKEQAGFLTRRTLSHVDGVHQMVKNTTDEIGSETDRCIDMLKTATRECMLTIEKHTESLTETAIHSRPENDNLNQKILEKETELAELKSTMSDIQKRKHYNHLDVAMQAEKKCVITGMVKVDASKLAVVDNINNRVKIINVHKNEIESSVEVKYPYAITRVDDNKLVVSCERMLQFLGHKDGKLTVDAKQIALAGDIRGIAFAGGRLAVTVMGPADDKEAEDDICIIDTEGEILNTISLGKSVMPFYVIFGRDKLYTTCYDIHKVMCFDNSGSLEYALTNDDMKGLLGLTIDDKGNVYIAGSKSNNIHVIRVSDEIPQVTKFLVVKDGIKTPRALAYCHIENKLYVSQAGSKANIVSVYNGLDHVSPVDGDESS